MKKILSFIILFSLLLSITLPYNVSASRKSKITYQQAIENAKKAFNLDTKDYEISHSYSENEDGKGSYSLEWTKKDSSGSIKGAVYVTVDALTGEILNMNSFVPNEGSQNKIPKYSEAEALKAAEDFAKKIQPQKFNQTKLVVNEYSQNAAYTNTIYSFNFVRMANGIEFTENGIKIEVDKNTLRITGYYYSWDDDQLPNISKVISLEKAKEIFKEKLGIELSYRLITKQGSKEPTPILVYTLKSDNHLIDAITGEVLDSPYIVAYARSMAKLSDGKKYDLNQLTPEELKSIEENSKFISKDTAAAVIEKYIPQIKDFKLKSSQLYSIGNDGSSAKWVFSWTYTSSEKGSTAYSSINAEVDASNSKIISFYLDGDKFNPDSKTEPSYSKEDSKAAAEKFLKEIEPDKFNQCEYRDLNRSYGINRNSSYYFNYLRKYDGAVCPFNTLSISVNPYTGQIMSYNCNWKEYVLPSTKGAMKLEDAYKTLFEKVDFSLKYIRFRTEAIKYDKYDIKLAYAIDNNFTMFDAENGTLLDYNGNPLKKATTPIFTDIKGKPYEKDIMILIELGIIDGESGKFNPNSEILQKDFIKLVVKSTYPYIDERNEGSDYDIYYKEAIARKIISEAEKEPDSKVTRLQAAKILIKALGYGSIAELSDIYYFKANDLKSIPNNMTGYAVLSSRLGIIKLNNGNFNPSSTLKRGEAASIMINYLNVDLPAAQ